MWHPRGTFSRLLVEVGGSTWQPLEGSCVSLPPPSAALRGLFAHPVTFWLQQPVLMNQSVTSRVLGGADGGECRPELPSRSCLHPHPAGDVLTVVRDGGVDVCFLGGRGDNRTSGLPAEAVFHD